MAACVLPGARRALTRATCYHVSHSLPKLLFSNVQNGAIFAPVQVIKIRFAKNIASAMVWVEECKRHCIRWWDDESNWKSQNSAHYFQFIFHGLSPYWSGSNMFEYDGSARAGGALAPSMLLTGISVKRSGLKALLRAHPEFKLLLAGSIEFCKTFMHHDFLSFAAYQFQALLKVGTSY
jgi:hypothetical protein